MYTHNDTHQFLNLITYETTEKYNLQQSLHIHGVLRLIIFKMETTWNWYRIR